MTKVAQQIKSKLQEKGLSVHALEKIAGLKTNIIHNILQGKSKNPTIGTMQAISQALNCHIDELVSDKKLTQPTLAPSVWNSALYLEAVQVACETFEAKKINIKKEKALLYIDEIYSYAITGKCKHIDKRFAQWLIDKGSEI